jgi:hypothetical protein
MLCLRGLVRRQTAFFETLLGGMLTSDGPTLDKAVIFKPDFTVQ